MPKITKAELKERNEKLQREMADIQITHDSEELEKTRLTYQTQRELQTSVIRLQMHMDNVGVTMAWAEEEMNKLKRLLGMKVEHTENVGYIDKYGIPTITARHPLPGKVEP